VNGASGAAHSAGHRAAWLAVTLMVATALLVAAGAAVGSLGWEPLWADASDAAASVLWDIRIPRTLGAWLAGALLGLAGALAQGLFRNPLADPYLLGSATGAALGVAVLLVLTGSTSIAADGVARLGMTGAAFLGAVAAVLVTLGLARGVQHTLRLLLAGVVVGMVFGAFAALVMFWSPEILRSMQGFLLGTTGFLGWASVAQLAALGALCLLVAVAFSRALDALALGETTAVSLGVALTPVRVVLIASMALATGAAVANVGLIAFIGLVAPHLVRATARPTHRWLLPLSALAGGVLLLAADVLARWMLAPREVPVGVLTAVLGGGYLLRAMHRRPT
jgi:iron complex transport system permease protein